MIYKTKTINYNRGEFLYLGPHVDIKVPGLISLEPFIDNSFTYVLSGAVSRSETTTGPR